MQILVKYSLERTTVNQFQLNSVFVPLQFLQDHCMITRHILLVSVLKCSGSLFNIPWNIVWPHTCDLLHIRCPPWQCGFSHTDNVWCVGFPLWDMGVLTPIMYGQEKFQLCCVFAFLVINENTLIEKKFFLLYPMKCRNRCSAFLLSSVFVIFFKELVLFERTSEDINYLWLIWFNFCMMLGSPFFPSSSPSCKSVTFLPRQCSSW